MSGLPTTILDWCFPPRTEELLVRSLSADGIIPTPYYPRRDVTCLLPFNHSSVQALIHEAKFFYNRRAHRLLGTALYSYLSTRSTPYILIPLPLHPRRQRARGFNQIQACLTAHSSLQKHLHTRALKRVRYTIPQTQLSATARLENMVNAFAVTRAGWRLPSDTELIVIDDVYTTGATMHSALEALQTALPNPIHGICFSYA